MVYPGLQNQESLSTDRRTFLCGAVLMGLLFSTRSSLAIESPSKSRVYRIGVLDPEPDAHLALWNEFVAELARRGYIEGGNVVFERRVVKGPQHRDLLAKAAAELTASRVDLIFAARGTESAIAAKRATTSIPIVFYSSADPDIGLVASLSRPGGNLTGSSVLSAEIAAKNIQFLVEALGKDRLRIAQIQSRGTRSLPWSPALEASISKAADRVGARYEYVDVDSIAEIEPLLRRLSQERIDAVTFESLLLMDESQFRRLADILVELRLPSIGDAESGFLFSYEPDWLQVARIAAQNVAQILSGTSPAQLPVQHPTIFELSINLRTAKSIGLSIPQSLILRADHIVR